MCNKDIQPCFFVKCFVMDPFSRLNNSEIMSQSFDLLYTVQGVSNESDM